ncbi:Conserved_hypothetical protein [Hexamita inflata]|uniref:DUF1963 domain-containing protein n=1 Tax=Hexamita inflata TaxID=28002 RepID=A0AA86QCE4_9EUKA|nr:Conserved hypothetical protein [Hexamita inflata]
MSDVKKNEKTRSKQFPFKYQIILKTNPAPNPNKLICSKLGGIPFVPQSLDFARNVSGNILPLFCQINFSDMPALRGFPTSGLFQLFISDDLECFECDQIVGDEVVVRFLSEAQISEQGRAMSEYTSKQPWMLEGAPVQKIIGIKAPYRIKYHGHKIGGVANFTQDKEYSEYINFLQFDSSDGIMIGDAGIMHIFVKRKDLENLDFSKAVFYFDQY